jgi:hypothetical protein
LSWIVHITANRTNIFCHSLYLLFLSFLKLYRFSKINSEIRKGGISGCRKNVRITEHFFDNHYNRIYRTQ